MSHVVAIIGGGAAGMMTAATLVERENFDGHVILFEKNSRLGAKVIISGGGRCNVTTGIYKRKELLQNYTRGADFLDFSFRQFGPRQVRKRFEDHGVPLKEEEDGRVFPVSDDGKDIVGVFETLFEKYAVEVRFKENVESIQKEPDSQRYLITTSTGIFPVDKVVIATGGQAYQKTGSTGDGYGFARGLGHHVTPLGPSLNSFLTSTIWLHELSGVAFPEASIHIPVLGKTLGPAPVLLTHFGISGPLAFVVASHAAFEDVSGESPLQVDLQVIAEMNVQDREEFLLACSFSSPKKKISTILAEKLPKRFVQAFLGEFHIPLHLQISELSKVDRQKLTELLGGGIGVECVGRRPGDEFVTAGGVDTSEINPKTMESLLSSGVYFVGEVVNEDGVTGGFNLQASWAMGRIVGLNM